ncbi:hypothetical protein MNBD_BACTEROID03-220 [hydrothermal vent metagenome]|jgi:hypothetical protein|uniref:Uncharacterized protein n=1 Tax=hydrothermal vent metagenome TaxID=652676 RepID=A0A3B0TEI4_9ZZZZ
MDDVVAFSFYNAVIDFDSCSYRNYEQGGKAENEQV